MSIPNFINDRSDFGKTRWAPQVKGLEQSPNPLNFILSLWRNSAACGACTAITTVAVQEWRNSATSLQFRLNQSVIAVLTAVEDVYALNFGVEKDEKVVA